MMSVMLKDENAVGRDELADSVGELAQRFIAVFCAEWTHKAH
jgi:hypothetical protein